MGQIITRVWPVENNYQNYKQWLDNPNLNPNHNPNPNPIHNPNPNPIHNPKPNPNPNPNN